MNINISGKQITVTAGMREKITKKLSKLSTFLDEDTPVNVIVRTVKDDQIIEVTIPLKDRKTVRAEERDRDFYAAVDMVEESLVRQLRKLKDRKIGHRRNVGAGVEMQMPEQMEEIVREKKVELRIEPLAEAVEELEMLGHAFHLFLLEDAKAGCVPAVVYRRQDGGYGVIRGLLS